MQTLESEPPTAFAWMRKAAFGFHALLMESTFAFKKVEKYFPYSVFGMSSVKEGLTIKAYSPPLKN